MKSDVQNQQSKSPEAPVEQARGKDLREKMIQSAEEGEEYRAEHQGQDAKLKG